MTENRFERLGKLRAEIARLGEQYAELEADLAALTQVSDTVQGSGTHFPYTLHSIGITGAVPLDTSEVHALRAKLAALRAQTKNKRQEYLREYDALSAAIASVEDIDLRTMLHYRYVLSMNYAAIARKMTELYHDTRMFTEDGVRVRMRRYLVASV